MKLESHGGGVEPDGQIDLLVHGIQDPGPSITSQLTQLLQRRLLLIAVDMLSAVLTKNPHFHWKKADLDFIHSFEDEWRALDETHDTKPEDKFAEYRFPRIPTDPGMILLFFRQNLCGSTFFHRLHETVGDVKYDKDVEFDKEETVNFDVHDFTFYYNNSPSKLDPTFQSVCTLTEKGAGNSIFSLSIRNTSAFRFFDSIQGIGPNLCRLKATAVRPVLALQSLRFLW